MEKIPWSMGFSHGICVDSKGKSRGLALWWKDGIEVTVRPWCQYFIDAKIVSHNVAWRFTGIYGEPHTELRGKTWDILCFLRAQDDLPWLCTGDFNEILKQEEQFGQNSRNENQMMAFRDCLADCRLANLGFSGYSFTWDNRRDGEANVQARLDRATAMAEFLQLFPHTAVEHIVTEESDHAALLIRVRSNSDRLSHKPRGFMYEEMWTKHEQYDELVMSVWEDGQGYRSNLSGLWSRLHDVSKELKKWSFDVFGSVCQQIKKLRSAIAEAKTNALASGSSLEVRELEK
jgi:hypothetical protein